MKENTVLRVADRFCALAKLGDCVSFKCLTGLQIKNVHDEGIQFSFL